MGPDHGYCVASYHCYTLIGFLSLLLVPLNLLSSMAVMDSSRADVSEVSLITVSQRLCGVKGQQA